MLPPNVYELCRSGKSVSAEVAANPLEAPADASKRLFGAHAEDDLKDRKGTAPVHSANDLQQAFECGKWGETRPSDLFLQIYHDVLCTLESNPVVGVTSPSLMGSNGICPLTIMSTIPDICRHMSNVIARAEREVYLATNFWMFSEPTRLITNALQELSRKAVANGTKIVVKIIYDRGNMKQFVNNHQPVLPKEYADPKGPVRIPHPDDLPGLHLEVVNFHRPMFGTFHSKYMVVDRKIAIIQSNNIQDNDNMEMMIQLEGPIVDSFYDVALISWHNAMKPPLPCLNSPAANSPLPTFESPTHAILPHGDAEIQDIAAKGSNTDLPQHTSEDPHYDPDIASEIMRSTAFLKPRSGEARINAVTRLLNTTIQPNTTGSAPEIEPHETLTPMIPIPPHKPFPIAMVCREPWGTPNKHSLYVPQDEAFTAALRHAKQSVFIQTPNLNAEALLPEILAACRRGISVTYYYCLGYNDAGELLPMQGGHNESIAHHLFSELEPEFNQNLTVCAYIGKDQVHPIHNKFKKRSCHIKLMVVDGHIGIQGNGNQDTQSWYHSQEVNVMIDSALVCGRWIQGIDQNQNTHLYGEVERHGDLAGCWRDPKTGEQAEGAIGPDAGHFAWAKGVKGAVQRVRGAGGF